MQGFGGFSALRRVYRLCAAGLCLSLVACAASYTKFYRPAALSLPPLTSPMAAVAQLSTVTGEHGWRDHLQVVRSDGSSYACRFRDTPDPQQTEHYNAFNARLVSSVTVACDNGLRYTRNADGNRYSASANGTLGDGAGQLTDQARTIALLWYQLSRVPADNNFDTQAAAYRALPVKPELPEAAREFKVRAESAVAEKRFLDAVEAYDRGLQVEPAWPQGHFNVALVLAELKVYGLAVEEMQRYLALVPDAANARQAQNRIYEWKAKLEKPR